MLLLLCSPVPKWYKASIITQCVHSYVHTAVLGLELTTVDGLELTCQLLLHLIPTTVSGMWMTLIQFQPQSLHVDDTNGPGSLTDMLMTPMDSSSRSLWHVDDSYILF